MPAYAYPIKVNYDREIVRTEHCKRIDNRLTVKKLKAIVGDTVFSIAPDDEQFSTDYLVSWATKRPETDEEMTARIKKGETYNHNRDVFLKTGKLPKSDISPEHT